MTAAVHGKAALAEMLVDDGAGPSRSIDDDRDKTDTVDFGATLMSLVDARAGNNSGAEAAASASSAKGSSTSQAPDSDDVSDDAKATPGEHYSSTLLDSTATPDAGAGRALSDRIAALFSSHFDDAPASSIHENLESASDPHPIKTNSIAAPLESDTQFTLTAANNSAVSKQDITPDFRKEAFTAGLEDDAAGADGSNFSHSPTVTIDAHNEATPATHATNGAALTDSANPHSAHAQNGTSPALSAQDPSPNRDTMKTAVSPNSQATPAETSATPAGLQRIAQQEGPAEVTSESPRARISNKEAGAQPTAAASPDTDAALSTGAQPAARAPEATAIHQVIEPAPSQASRSVNLTIQLSEGQAAQASVRERAGAVEVKIVAPNAAAAQRVSSEIDGMRRNLSAAGIKLGHSEVSYQHSDGGGRQSREQYRPQAQNQSADGKEVFVMNEVIQ